MTPHIEAKPGDYADTILLPGDPLRAKWIAETFFSGPKCVNSVRNCLGYTGTYKGNPVSVQATGMGQPSLAIYVNELITEYGAKTLVRVGTCGGLSEKVMVRDLVIAMTACTDNGVNRAHFAPFDFAPCADFALLQRAVQLAQEKGARYHVGSIVSSDVFYREGGLAAYEKLCKHGILGTEMETSTLYTLAARFGVRALSVCSMSDSLVTGEEINSSERQATLSDLVELALDTVSTD